MLPSLKERLSIYDDDNEVVKGVLKGATRKFRSRIVILNPLLDAHIDQGHTLLQMLAFLRVNRDKWTYENDELIIDSDDLLDEYDTLIETLTQLQEKTENLSRQATEEL